MATLPPDAAPGTTPKKADLVLEGGGVKGIALVGAAVALAEDGYRFERVAGSSAGALVGAIIVAMQQRNAHFLGNGQSAQQFLERHPQQCVHQRHDAGHESVVF